MKNQVVYWLCGVVLLTGAIADGLPFPLRLLFPQQTQRVLAGTVLLEFRREINKPEIQVQLQERRTQLIQLNLKQAQLEQTNNPEAIAQIREQINQKNREIQSLLSQLYESVGLNQNHVKDALATPDESNNWNVEIEFNSEGAKKFAQLTQSMAGTGRTIGIFLNNELISAPIVDAQYAETGIIGGRVVITGNFTAKSADELAVQLRGATSAKP